MFSLLFCFLKFQSSNYQKLTDENFKSIVLQDSAKNVYVATVEPSNLLCWSFGRGSYKVMSQINCSIFHVAIVDREVANRADFWTTWRWKEWWNCPLPYLTKNLTWCWRDTNSYITETIILLLLRSRSTLLTLEFFLVIDFKFQLNFRF